MVEIIKTLLVIAVFIVFASFYLLIRSYQELRNIKWLKNETINIFWRLGYSRGYFDCLFNKGTPPKQKECQECIACKKSKWKGKECINNMCLNCWGTGAFQDELD